MLKLKQCHHDEQKITHTYNLPGKKNPAIAGFKFEDDYGNLGTKVTTEQLTPGGCS